MRKRGRQQAGIPAHVFNEHVQSIVGDVPPDVAQPQVWLERPAEWQGTPSDEQREAALDRIRQSVFSRLSQLTRA